MTVSSRTRSAPAGTGLRRAATEVFRLFRADPAAILLVVANLVPLAEFVRRGEPVGAILIVYWMQFLVIGFWTDVKLIVVGRVWAILLVPLFSLIYFSIVTMFGFVAGGLLDDQMRGTAWHEQFTPWNYAWAGVAFFLTHAVSFAVHFVGRREHARSTWQEVIARSVGRVVPMWLAALLGGVVGGFLTSATAVVVLVVPVKIVLDLVGHFAEHDAFAGGTKRRERQ